MKFKNVFVILFVSLFVSSAFAEELGKIRIFTGLEYWLKANAYEKTKDAYRERQESDRHDIAMVNSTSLNVSDAMGVRAGVSFPVMVRGLQVKASLGYIKGPKGKFVYEFDDHNSFFRNHQVETEILTTSFIRALSEVSYDMPIGEKAIFRMQVGAGIAKGKMKQSFDNIYYLPAGSPIDESVSNNWSGFTYEVGPSFLFKFPKANVELKMLYMALPKMKAVFPDPASFHVRNSLKAFKWNPFGFQLAVEF